MSKYIEFKLIEKKPKTNVYSVKRLDSDISLGTIQWYSAWRQYCFFPLPHTIFNHDCMQYIIDYIKELMEMRKLERVREKFSGGK